MKTASKVISTAHLLLIWTLIPLLSVYAQNSEQEVHIKIQQNINGKVIEIDTVLRGNEIQDNSFLNNFSFKFGIPDEEKVLPDTGNDDPSSSPSGSLSDKLHNRAPQHSYSKGNNNTQVLSNEASLGIVVDAKEAEDDDEGVKIAKVVSGSAAEKAGLQAGDLIMSIDGKELYASDDLIQEIGKHKAGDVVLLSYIRNGKKGETTATLQTPDFNEVFQDPSWMGNFFSPDIWGNDPGMNNWAEELDRFRRQMEEQMGKWNLQNKEKEDVWNDFDEEFSKPTPTPLPINPGTANELIPDKMSLAVNASQKKFDLTFSLPESGNAVIRILDAEGNILFEDKYSNFPGTYKNSITLKNKPFGGTYFFQIVQNGKMYNKKIVAN